MKRYLVTHIDLDGAGVAVLAKRFFASSLISISYQNYDTIDSYLVDLFKIVKPGDEILIADICPSQEVCNFLLDAITKNGLNIKLFDHHASQRWVEQYAWAKFDENKCGTTLVYEHFLKLDAEKIKDYEKFAKAVEAWDIWLLDSTHRKQGKDLHTLYTFIGAQEFITLFSECPNADDKLQDTIKYIDRKKDRVVSQALKYMLETGYVNYDSQGRSFVIIHATDYVSEIAHAILTHESFNDLSYVIVYNPILESCSLRSLKDVDVSIIAKKLGGGGHKNAAGFLHRSKNNNELAIFKMVNSLELG